MINRGKKIPFPAITQVSFISVLEMLEKQAKDTDENVSIFAKNLLAESAKYPMLRDGIDSIDFDGSLEIVKRLSRVLFPDVLLSNEIKALIPPFEFAPFYTSTRFRNILEASQEDFSFELQDYSEDQLYIYGCAAILSMHYNYPFPSGLPRLVTIPNKKTAAIATYGMTMNGDLLHIIPGPNAIDITHDDYLKLLDNFENIELWKEKFPLESWIIKGIGITNLMDISVDHAISTIASNLLGHSSDTESKIYEGLIRLFGIKDLSIGLLMYNDNMLSRHFIHSIPTILCSEMKSLDCKTNMCLHTYQMILDQEKPFVVSDVEGFDNRSGSGFSKALHKLGIGSYIISPIRHNDKFLGFFELASKQKHQLNGASLQRLDAVMPILSMAINRIMVELQNRREAIIQQECTTIHPAVKWRFEEEANKFMALEESGEQSTFSDIAFKNVYPLYGQLDIKGSTERRNQAVREDLSRQLSEVSELLKMVLEKTSMPIYEEMEIRVIHYRKELDGELLSGSEHRILHFLEDEIHPVFKQIRKRYPALQTAIDSYFSLLDPDMHSIYDARKVYDRSVNHINQSLASYLDERQLDAQKMFPHYFERYKTDGVEYNMYIGQSISKELEFNPVFLENLQLWQLMVTCELERKLVDIKKEINSDIEVASLILVYSSPLAVHFRMDEKRFDVEGAYNARYEIVKKRIDKARIKGTRERITAPGKLAINYTSESDATTYLRYIKYLENKGYVKKNSTEVLALENLQDIFGLKALRVEINYESRGQEPVDLKGLLTGIEQN